MGGCWSSDEHDDELLQHKKRRQSSMGVGMGVAMMMQQAGALVGGPRLDVTQIQSQIRKAKAEGRTVTIVNGSLYFDYHLVAHIPPNYDIRV